MRERGIMYYIYILYLYHSWLGSVLSIGFTLGTCSLSSKSMARFSTQYLIKDPPRLYPNTHLLSSCPHLQLPTLCILIPPTWILWPYTLRQQQNGLAVRSWIHHSKYEQNIQSTEKENMISPLALQIWALWWLMVWKCAFILDKCSVEKRGHTLHFNSTTKRTIQINHYSTRYR